MSALKKGALLKAFAGKLADAEKVALPYDGRVVLKKHRKRSANNISNKASFSFKEQHVTHHFSTCPTLGDD